MRMMKSWMLHFWAVFIAVVLWIQVHGEGEGTVSLDVPIQVQGLPEQMVIVNNLPSKVRITVKGLQARLKSLQEKDVFVPLDVSDLSEPGVIQRAFNMASVHLPASLSVEKIQPDHLEVQIDRVVTRSVAVHPNFDLPDEWEAQMVSVQPAMVHIQGPEVWLESLTSVETLPLKPALKEGRMEFKVGIIVPAEKSVHLEEVDTKFLVRGNLARKPVVKMVMSPANIPSLEPTLPAVRDGYVEALIPETLPNKPVVQDEYAAPSTSEMMPAMSAEEVPQADAVPTSSLELPPKPVHDTLQGDLESQKTEQEQQP